ncbi:NAD(P)H-dependent oxidoreductase [Neisseria leonii]|uniref:NAD(P)H-dependent oxidoreductase n=1 Tax=Neisseria leonii TaxID=2995413 RepID=UPI00237A7F55|nr:NAD(P)H-dependent oxidoreductase [Neisseria sp. 3986]MDD9324974.1 NAD(P)H-dependent oxidoreductase [Neisseria sp. 3986]
MRIDPQTILAAHRRRYACKQYDPAKKISDDDFAVILETGRLSPSSFGFEPWRFLVVQNPKIRNLIHDNAWGAKGKAADCSHFVVILNRKGSTMNAGGEYFEHSMREIQQRPPEVVDRYTGFFADFIAKDFRLNESGRAFDDWTARQCYIALANMLTAAAMLDIDSTPIEGFDAAELNRLLAAEGLFDPQEFSVCVMAAFGYRAEEIRPKTRQDTQTVIRWVH